MPSKSLWQPRLASAPITNSPASTTFVAARSTRTASISMASRFTGRCLSIADSKRDFPSSTATWSRRLTSLLVDSRRNMATRCRACLTSLMPTPKGSKPLWQPVCLAQTFMLVTGRRSSPSATDCATRPTNTCWAASRRRASTSPTSSIIKRISAGHQQRTGPSTPSSISIATTITSSPLTVKPSSERLRT